MDGNNSNDRFLFFEFQQFYRKMRRKCAKMRFFKFVSLDQSISFLLNRKLAFT